MTNVAFKSTTSRRPSGGERQHSTIHKEQGNAGDFGYIFQRQTCQCEREDGLEVNVGRLRGRVEERGFGPGLGGAELPANSSQSLKLAGERRGSHGAWLSVNQQSTLKNNNLRKWMQQTRRSMCVVDDDDLERRKQQQT